MSDIPKVVLLGKSTTKNPAIHNMLEGIDTIQIPNAFLDSVYVTTLEQEKFKIHKKHLKDGIHYSEIEKHLERLGMKDKVSLVEVIVNLDDAYAAIKLEAIEYLDAIFSNPNPQKS
jgi:hypothetical protein